MNKCECASGDGSVLTNQPEITKESDATKESGVFSEGHESNAQFVWRTPRLLNGLAEERAFYFNSLQKEMTSLGRRPKGHQAATLLDLITIRAFHSKSLRCYSLGTALGFRLRGGLQTRIPAIIVFVARKVHRHWLHENQELPTVLEGPGGVWCDVDVVEFSHLGSQRLPEPVYTELVDGLQGRDATIGAGSQIACYELYGTLGCIVRSRTGLCQVGFLTNRHVAVDLDHPVQKLFHPLPPHLGPGLYLGAVERTTTFIRDDLWYGVFASMNPETFVRADGAFIPFDNSFDVRNYVTPCVKGVGEVGEVMSVDLQAPLDSLIGKHVMKVGRSSGITKGSLLAYAVEYNNDKGHCFFNDFLIVSDNHQDFELEGDSGSLILVEGENVGDKARPIGIVWGGTTHRGRLKLQNTREPENWTSGVDLSRLLDSLELSIVTSNEALCEALEVQRQCLAASLHSSTHCLGIRSMISNTVPGRQMQYMDGGSFKFDQHIAGVDRICSSETLKDLLSTATFEAGAAHTQQNVLQMVPVQGSLECGRHSRSARRRADAVLKVDDPFELSLSSPLSGVEHSSNFIEEGYMRRTGAGLFGCRIPKPTSSYEAFQCGTKRTRQLAESRFLAPNS